jgi:iron complex outermembrane receptor protein
MGVSRNRFAAFVAIALLGLVPAALAQSANGRVSGVVRDASGAVAPGATITLTNQATKATHTATSGGDGSYSVSAPSGLYSASAVLRGVGHQSLRDLKLESGATLTTDFALTTRLAEEITVTSLKRESTLQEVPFSVAAPTEGELQRRGVDDIEGVARNVAGFSVQNLGPGQSQVAIRGVSSGQIARDQPGVKEQVGAYLDESVISLSLFTPDMDLFDMNRVEVLRGPQGTLFGSGSESGTVRYISNQPELGGKAKVFGEVSGNTIDGGNQGGNVKLGVNAALGSKAALRVAGYYTRFAGYIDTPGTQPAPSGGIRPDPGTRTEDVNTGDRTGVRAAIRIAPNDRLTITPRIVYQKVETDGWNRIDAYNIMANPYTTTRPPVALGEREQFTQIREPFTDKFVLGDLNIGYRFGTVALTSITSYTDRDVDVVRDATALTGGYTSLIWGVPENVYTLDAPLDDATHAKVFTQEIRFSGGKDRFQWVAGGFYADTKRNYGQRLFVDGFTELSGVPSAGQYAPNDVLFYSDLRYKLDQYAAFGEGTYSFSDQFSLTAGLRYYHFKEDRTQVFDGLFADPASKPGTIKADGVAPRLIATYKVSGTTNLNAQVSKGFRLGGINDQLNRPLCSPADLETFGGRDTWKDETAWNYEIGSKSRIRVAAAPSASQPSIWTCRTSRRR